MIARRALGRAGLLPEGAAGAELTAPRGLAPHRVAGALLAIHALVAVVNLSPLMESYTVETLLDVNREGTLIVWLSSATLLAIAALAAGGALATKGRDRFRWWAVAVGFAGLSADETASLHERVGEMAGRVFEVEWLPSLYLWVIVVAPVGLVFAVWMLRWFGRTMGWRTPAGRLMSSALLLWMLVPVLEALDPTLGGPRLLVVIEESLEGVGEALMVWALLIHRPRAIGRLEAIGEAAE